MAKQRYINTKFWSDSWVRQKLNPLDRYLFIYFLTNEHTNICGIYELPIDTIAFETGLDQNDIKRSYLSRLEPKVIYRSNWVILPNFLKHQNQGSPKIRVGIEEELKHIPSEIRDIAIRYGYGIDTLSHSNSNSNLNSNSNTNTKKESAVAIAPAAAEIQDKDSDTPDSRSRRFFVMVLENGPEHEDFIKKLAEKHNGKFEFFRNEIKKFTSYWTEPTRSGKKQRWEMERTFEISRRLATWFNRADRYSGGGNYQQAKGISV